MAEAWKVSVDTGGTFTDCIAVNPDGDRIKVKVLSSSALRGEVAEKKGNRRYRILQDWDAPDHFVNGFEFRLLHRPDITSKVIDFDASESIIKLEDEIEFAGPDIIGTSFEVVCSREAPILATRLATATTFEEDLPNINLHLATTKGTNALLENAGVPTALFITEGFGDLLQIGNQQRPDLFALQIDKPDVLYSEVVEVPERMDAEGAVLSSMNLKQIEERVERLLDRGIRSAAVVFMHSYKNNTHETKIREWLLDKGMDHVTISSDMSSFIKILPRAQTTVINAYLMPIIQDYLDAVHAAIPEGKIYVMTSAGGLKPTDQFKPKDSLLSGPAGGVVGAAGEGRKSGFDKIISFDMGGTSTDVARFDRDFEYVFEHQVGDAHLVAPALSIETVAAGGGSVCHFDGHKLSVGPDSAGAYPGPACYGAGGPLTITDVNLLLGRLDKRNFHIPVSVDNAKARLEEVVSALNSASGEEVTKESVLQSFLNIANERMADAIKKISIRKGYDTREYGLVSFGGAGGQHACAIARHLNIRNVIIPDEAGLLSATGLGHAVREEFAERQLLKPLNEVEDLVDRLLETLEAKARDKIQNSTDETIEIRRKMIRMRFKGQESTLDIEYGQDVNLEERFQEKYRARYGHWVDNRDIEVESIRVIASTVDRKAEEVTHTTGESTPSAQFEKQIWFNGTYYDTPVFDREQLQSGNLIEGPVLILDPHSTIVVEPGWEARVSDNLAIELSLNEDVSEREADTQPEAARLELFTNRFGSIATEMGEMLQRTSLSVNVKDRLDFSCALLSPDGELVVNAPHIPVHLGALGLCVRSVMETIEMGPGDVVVTNHPAYGGAHLPDVTVVSPIYTDDEQLIGYAASRAHHAEIGGAYPGSMPPEATNLSEEGVVIPPMYLIRKGEERWSDIRSELKSGPYPSRDIEENMADLQAAVAANHKGISSLKKMVEKYGLREVHHYMEALRKHAALKMRDTLDNLSNGEYRSTEYLDDGSKLNAKLEIKDKRITIDFNGTSGVHPKNLNATPAIVNSVIMYVLRLLINEPLPLNEGLLSPVEIILPDCLLNPVFKEDPADCPAVVGGNVEVSQRLVDTLLKPFEIIACSQGTMNNVLFGNDRFGYYETVGGGTGAGIDFDGADAVHHHMTNTRGTDPEILEHNYPVRLDRYAIRRDSGGDGAHKGGNGILREMTFLAPVRLTVLTQHRNEGPYGLKGGQPGKKGEQWVLYKDGRKEKLQSVDGRELDKGDRFILKTPGGGGYGKPD